MNEPVLAEGFPARQLDTNCWVLAAGGGQPCVVIDPGVGVLERLAATVQARRLRPVAVLLTHGHLDHTFSAAEICRMYQAPVYVHPDDRSQLADPHGGLGMPAGTPLFGRSSFAEPAVVQEFAAGPAGTLTLAGLDITVTASPGHTPGSVLLGVSGPDGPLTFSGDTLFAGSIGRMDLPGGSEPVMTQTLSRVVLALPDQTVIHPGHGPSTTIGAERAANPYLLALQRTAR